VISDNIRRKGMEKPRHKHFDCPSCQFLGGMQCEEEWVDMYCCDDIIVLRWGGSPDNPDGYVGVPPYSFGLWESVKDAIFWWPALAEARRRSLRI
jgi:hypothetical protein